MKRLTNLWVENDSKSLEDRAEECFHELVERNVVLVTGRHNFCGNVKTCKVQIALWTKD